MLTALCGLAIGGRRAQAQSIDDLDVVWSKTYGAGWIRGIKSMPDGSYLACGTGVNRTQGLIIEIDESGNEVRRLTATLPTSYTEPLNRADVWFKAAFKTSDGGILAFGVFQNLDAPFTDKQYNWNVGKTGVTSDPDHFNLSSYLLNGVWIVKFDSDGNEVRNFLTRGRSVTDVWRTNSNTFFIGGFDANATNDQDPSNIGVDITLLREYDSNGDLVRDLRAHHREITALYQYPDGSFLATTPDRLLRIDAAATTISPPVYYNSSLLPDATTDVYANYVSPNSNGGAFIAASLKMVTGDKSAYNTAMNGFGFYKINNSNGYVYHKIITPADTIMSAPLLLPGSSSKYVGTATVRNLDHTNQTVTNIADPYKIYEWSDEGTGYSYRTGASYPTGTSLMAVSRMDGFFSAGKNQNIGEAAIAKLSTCAKFKLNVGAATETYNGAGAFMLPARTVTYEGNEGVVDVSWTLTDVTPSGAAASLPTPSGSGVNIPAQTVSLLPGKEFAMLRYTITAVDSYMTGGGVPQTCQQTSTILIRIYRQYPDNIIEANCVINPEKQQWNILQKLPKIDSLATTQAFVAGDMNGDGFPDIVGYGKSDRKNIRIIWGPDFSTNSKYASPDAVAASTIAIAKVKVNDSPETYRTMIYYHGTNGLHAMKPDGTPEWTSSASVREAGMIGVADFNNDGWAEVYIGNQIYDAATGKLLCDGGAGENSGKSYIITGFKSLSMAIDILGDEKLELVAGNKIYGVEIDRATATPKSLTLLSSVTPPAGCLGDGPTVVADFDNDGNLDVLVRRKAVDNVWQNTDIHLYLWSPHTGTATGTIMAATTDANVFFGVPFVGDIDGDGKVEIVTLESNGTSHVTQTGGLKARRYNASTHSFDLSWAMDHTDQSGATGMTLFDFNNDGISEIVYRDENELRIINGSKIHHETESPVSGPYTLQSFTSYSETGAEYPIVVDIYGNGSSAILVTSDLEGPRGTGKGSSNGFDGNATVDIFTSDPSTPWARARKVWNQYAYNVVNVNEDLTIPRYPLSPATVFPGSDGQLYSNDDIRPYNNFLQQQTMLNENGTPFRLASNAGFDGLPVFRYDAAGDSLVITVKVKNTGDLGLLDPLYISTLKREGTASTPELIAIDSINPSEANPVTATLTVRNFSTYYPFASIIVKLNSKDGVTYIQPDCDYGNNEEEYGEDALLRAHNDRVSTVATIPVTVPVLKNDSIPAACRPLVPETVGSALRGTVEVIGDSIRYTYNPADPALLSDPHFVDFDTVAYRIACGADTSTAKVYVVITGFPDNIIAADCYDVPPADNWSFREIGRTSSSYPVSTMGMVYAGDIDGDDHVEILALKRSGSDTYGYDPESTLYIFNDNLGLKYTITLAKGVSPITGAISIADVDGDGYAEIFACSHDGYLLKYSFNKSTQTFVQASGSPVQHATTSYHFDCQPMITDFNGDGIPEVLALDMVYNAQTLALLVDGEMKKSYGDLGFGAGHATVNSNSDAPNRQTRMIAVGDIDNDGLPEVLAGATAYKVRITNTTGTTGNTFTVHKQADKTGRPEVGSGATAIADMDLDGYLDVIVSRRISPENGSSNRAAIYIWNPRTGKIMNTNVINNGYVYSGTYGPNGPSIPFIGDIDGDRKPEIVIVLRNSSGGSHGSDVGKVIAYDFEDGQLKTKWTKTTSDFSGATGITLFDFNQDGAGELVYRDVTHLRILRGSDGGDIISVNCTSPTGIEYPIVVDYNNDGAAEILVTGRNPGSSTNYTPPADGTIRAYGSSGSKWAPARKVWNQYMYNVVNINDDLTVPRYQTNPATVFPNGARPYNNFLQQQTSLDVAGNRIWLLPDLVLTSGTLAVSDGTATVTLNITNQGDARLGPPIYVSFYRNAISLDNHFKTVSIDRQIDPGNTIQESFNFPDEVALNIIARVNDSVHVASNGAKTWVFPVRPECDDPEYLNNAYMIPNPYSSGLMTKKATLIPSDDAPFQHDGTYDNPVTVFFGDTIEYEITVVNLTGGNITVRDRLPSYMRYGRTMPPSSLLYTVTPPTIMPFGDQVELSWTLSGLNRTAEGKVAFRTGLTEGVNASQPLYVNQAQVEMPNPNGSGIIAVPTTSTYHQGAGVSVVTFSASPGGSVYNNEPQAVDYRMSASEGVLVVPDEGYRFAGWSHDEYYSHRGKRIPAQSGIFRYDSLTIRGNVDLRAEFAPNRYPIRYYLHGGANDAANPPDYTVEEDAITLAPPSKPDDVFIGWTGSNGDTPQEEATIPLRSTGERVYYANYLYSGRETVVSQEVEAGDNIWAAGNEAYIRTSRAGSIVRVYTPDGVLHRRHTILAPGLTKIRLAEGLYIITLNNGDGRKVVVSD
jgi:uncharacterized repeat protein (TIGR02543 family)